MGRHDDEITVALCGDADNRLVRMCAIRRHRIALDTCLRGRSGDDRKGVIRTFSAGLNDALLIVDLCNASLTRIELQDPGSGA